MPRMRDAVVVSAPGLPGVKMMREWVRRSGYREAMLASWRKSLCDVMPHDGGAIALADGATEET